MNDYIELDAFIAELIADGLTYKATFVPQSASRNSGEKQPTLNWRIALVNKKDTRFDTDYTQGIGNMPGKKPVFQDGRVDQYKQRLREQEASETGFYTDANGYNRKRLPAPELRGVLYSLVLDSKSLEDACGFEDWANDLGYDIDSRKAEKAYEACKKIAFDLRQLLGRSNINRLAELFQDY